MKTTEIPVYCWQCGKRFEIEIRNVVAGRLFCSPECSMKDFKRELAERELGTRKRERG